MNLTALGSTYSANIAGEIKRVDKAQPLAQYGSIILFIIYYQIFTYVTYHGFGKDLMEAISKLNASGEGGFGFVIASGYRGSGSALSVDVANGGDMDVVANAVVAEGASAAAAGIVLQAAAPFSATGVEAFLEGSLTNAGSLHVLASASGGLVTTGTGVMPS